MLSSWINFVHVSVINVKFIRRYCRSNDKKIVAATHTFKLVKKNIEDQANESESDDDTDILLNPDDDPEIKYFKSLYKKIPICYPLTLNWTKIPCLFSKTMQLWREEHVAVSRTYSNCQNRVYTATLIIQHATTLGDAKHYPHYETGKHLQILNGAITID